jgi:hypothetical protein
MATTAGSQKLNRPLIWRSSETAYNNLNRFIKGEDWNLPFLFPRES